MRFETILFDFHGVLCSDHLFVGLETVHPRAHRFIEKDIFGGGSDIPDRWMRGEISVDDVKRYISDNTGVDRDLLSRVLRESIEAMRIEARLLALARRLSAAGGRVALVTDNMDVFNRLVVPHHGLGGYFPVIVNSCDHGLLKKEENGALFDIALEKLGVSGFDKTLLIDDSKSVGPVFKGRGGTVYLYETYERFEPWMGDNLPGGFDLRRPI
jgi:FMN phosphatase YigB (HAD superfamily)